MKYIEEFRNPKIIGKLVFQLKNEVDPNKKYSIMEFCGGHTHALFRYGIYDIIPKNVNMIHGPGCPVCILPMGIIDTILEFSLKNDIIIATYGDLMRVPGSDGMNLLKVKALGGDIRIIYSSLDALKIAKENPKKQVVFIAIGFETTTPQTAFVIKKAFKENIQNFSIFCNHVLTDVIIDTILKSKEILIDGIIGPAHVSTILGSDTYKNVIDNYNISVVIAGFEPIDVLQALFMLVKQINEGQNSIENQYLRAVTLNGNLIAKKIIDEVFDIDDKYIWRGFGKIPNSSLKIKKIYQDHDFTKKFSVKPKEILDNKNCECGNIVRGLKKPIDCKLFAKVCNPENPQGSCMVSSEGACAAYYNYRRFL